MKKLLVLLGLCLVSSMGFAGCEQNPGECSEYTPDSSTVSNTDDEDKSETQKSPDDEDKTATQKLEE